MDGNAMLENQALVLCFIANVCDSETICVANDGIIVIIIIIIIIIIICVTETSLTRSV